MKAPLERQVDGVVVFSNHNINQDLKTKLVHGTFGNQRDHCFVIMYCCVRVCRVFFFFSFLLSLCLYSAQEGSVFCILFIDGTNRTKDAHAKGKHGRCAVQRKNPSSL